MQRIEMAYCTSLHAAVKESVFSTSEPSLCNKNTSCCFVLLVQCLVFHGGGARVAFFQPGNIWVRKRKHSAIHVNGKILPFLQYRIAGNFRTV